jgi:hypothetical protein
MWHSHGTSAPGPPSGTHQPDPVSSSVDVNGSAAVSRVVEHQPCISGDKGAPPGGTFSTKEGVIWAGALDNCNSGGVSTSNLGGVRSSTKASASATHIDQRSAVSASTPTNVTAAAHDSRDISRLIIPWNALKVGSALGNGGFGTVYMGSWCGHEVAIKMLDRSSLSEAAHAALRQESLMMCRLRHPGIAQCYGLVDEDGHRALVMK